MKFVLIGDSHCRDLDEALSLLFPSFKIYTISVGAQIEDIKAAYRSKIAAITASTPAYIIIHMGHNNIAYHHRYNPSPEELPKTVAEATIDLANEVRSHHPTSKIYVSTIFPRTHTRTYTLSPHEVVMYNKKAKRHGQRIQTLANRESLNYFMNNRMWHQISISLEDSNQFRGDGLHLSKEGAKKIMIEWLTILKIIT
jgi:lysophospholipase L1-like esterase